MDGNAGHEPEPLTLETLANLQAGLLDDDTAAALRQRIRTDRAAAEMLAALDRVRPTDRCVMRETSRAPPTANRTSAWQPSSASRTCANSAARRVKTQISALTTRPHPMSLPR